MSSTMKKIVPFFLLIMLTIMSCPVIPHQNSIARIKERYRCNVELVNNSSVTIQYKYAPVLQRMDLKSLPFYNDFVAAKDKLDKLDFDYIGMSYGFNIAGELAKGMQSTLYTGIDCGIHEFRPLLSGYPNANVDGLPARFAIMIEGDTRIYVLVHNCKKINKTSTVIITDETINRLKTFKDDEYAIDYNGKRESYGESVKIQDRLYCFERYDLKKNSLFDYNPIGEGDEIVYGIAGVGENTEILVGERKALFYGRVLTSVSNSDGYNKLKDRSEVLALNNKNNYVLLLNDNSKRYFYITVFEPTPVLLEL